MEKILMYRDLRDFVREERKRQQMTCDELANICGYKRSMIACFEIDRNKHDCMLNTASYILHGLGYKLAIVPLEE